MEGRIKITDLEKFAREQIYKPYMNELLRSLGKANGVVATLGDVEMYADNAPEWWAKVVDRINRCGFYFPSYISHPVVDMLRDSCSICGASPITVNCNNASCDK